MRRGWPLAKVVKARQMCIRDSKNRDAAQRAVQAIRQGVKALGKYPEMGRPIEELPPEFREWVIEFGSGAYVCLLYTSRCV